MNHIKKLFPTILLSLAWMALFDFFLGFFFIGYEYNPQKSKLNNYFCYGISTKRKLIEMLGQKDSERADIVRAGWYEEAFNSNHLNGGHCDYILAIYGMSFTDRIANELKSIEPSVCVRTLDGPGAPLSHSYYMYLRDRDAKKADIAVMGILASSLPGVLTVSHMTASFERPGAHFYPRYRVDNGALISTDAPVSSTDQLRAILRDQVRERELIAFLSKEDCFFSKLVFGHSWADYSMSARFLRRAYGQHFVNEKTKAVYRNGKFVNNEVIEVGQQLVKGFVEMAETDGAVPVIILINDRGYANSLDPIFGPYLKEHNIGLISTSDYINSKDLSNFQPDGHFSPKNDRLLAKALLRLIKKDIASRNRH